jgi:hypothetical protein
MLGTNGSSIRPQEKISPGRTSRRQKWYGTFMPTYMPTTPRPAHIS